jgi:branched-chain amino acid transport system permease protein
MLVAAFMFISMLAAYCIANSRYGRTLRSIRENEPLARSIGVNANMHKVGAFMLSGLFAGVGGDLQAYNFRHISPDLYGGATSLYFALMVMLGGPRTLFGPLAGAIIVTFLPEVMRIDPVDSRIAYGLALIAVVMLLPGGVIAAAGRFYQWATRTLRGARTNASSADPGASWT